MKKALLFTLAAVTACGMFTGCAKKSAAEGKVLNIACWNEEFQARFKDYFEAKGLVPDGVTVKWHITPNQDNAYQNRLDQQLYAQEKAPADEKIDLFLVEADYALKYVDTPFTLDVKKDIGLTDADLSKQYQYTKDVMTDKNGVLKGVTWQACPGGFIYRRSIAKDVLGTDKPEEVQKFLATWNDFDSVAAQAKSKGYFMLSGFDDAYRVFSDNITTPAVVDGKIEIDPLIKRWISQTKTYTEKGYNNKANLWSAESFKGAGKDGKVFGYFGPAWFIDFCLAPATKDDPEGPNALGNGSYGDWAFCRGPQGFSWGGTWICAAAGTDNVDLIKDTTSSISVTEISDDPMNATELKYSDWCKMIVNMIWSEDQPLFLECTKPDYLKKNLAPGRTTSFDCQMQNLEGKYIWVKLIFSRAETNNNDDFRFVFMVQDIHENSVGLMSALKEYEELASKDSLTGLYNHGRIETELYNAIENNRENERSISIMIMDIDYFKKVNDKYGHSIGDITLKHLVAITCDFLQSYNIKIGR